MTPFGWRIREMRRQKGVTLKKMAADLNLSAAYLSALEHGRRGRPSPGLVMQILGYFNVIWDDAEEANRLKERIALMPEEQLRHLLDELNR